MMTPAYASPEQVKGEPLGTTSDIYSLGVLLYELLCGSPPYEFANPSPLQVATIVCEQDPPAPSARVAATDRRLAHQLGGDLDSIVLMAMRKEPALRYASADMLRQDVERSLAGQPVLAHRGISAVRMAFKGQAGHASAENALSLSALHNAMRWGTSALDFVQAQHHLRFGGLTGLRFNIGRVEGGIKANMIAPSAEVRFGFRPLPSQDPAELHATFRGLANADALAEYEETFRGPSLPSGDVARAEERRLAARDLADELGLPIGNAVDFWTEASLFSAAGLTAFVYGPGDIAQAHTADEWVALEQLQRYAESVARILQ